MKCRHVCICLILLCNAGCIFSGGDIEETKLIEPYYITNSGIKYELIVKEKDASTNKVMVSSNVDSIGWDDKYIFGKTQLEYFIIRRDSQNFVGKYNDFFKFAKVKDSLALKSEMRKTSEL